MRIVQITDSHIYADPDARLGGVDTRSSFEQVLAAALQQENIDLLILTGDNSMDGSEASYRWLHHALREVGVPVAVLPGNHDDCETWDVLGDITHQRPSVLVQQGEWLIIGLSTRVAGSAHGQMSDDDLAALDDVLSKRASRNVVLFMHHPPIPVNSDWIDAIGLQDRARFWSLLQCHGQVRGIVCGHVHQNHDRYCGVVRVLATPSSCAQFAPRAKRFSFDQRAPGYRVIDLLDNGVISTNIVRVPLAK